MTHLGQKIDRVRRAAKELEAALTDLSRQGAVEDLCADIMNIPIQFIESPVSTPLFVVRVSARNHPVIAP